MRRCAAKMARAAAAAGFHGARVTEMHNVGDICLLRLGLELPEDALSTTAKPFSFAPGQWVDYYIPECDSVGGFSIVSSPDALPDCLDLAVKFSANSKAAKFIHHDQQAGDLVFLRSGGDVHWDPVSDPASASLLLAGGIGITPFLSMCSRLHNNIGKTHSRIALVHSARRLENGDDTIRWPEQDLLAKLGDNKQIRIETLRTDGTCAGRIDEASVERALQFLQREGGREGPDVPEGPVRPFVCGPEGFVSTASSLLVAGFGFHEEDLLIEKWW
jgi:ferredoxin-NADP reductase